MAVAALFVRKDNHYASLGCDCYDEERDALTWPGGCPIVAHPPCRTWSRLAHFVKDSASHERELALWSISMVRRFGGVVEHPKDSRLWRAVGCLTPGVRDQHGGVLLTLNQGDFGHEAPKATAIYVVGAHVPALPFELAAPVGRVERLCRAKRERTPPAFAALLVHLARQSVGVVA